MKIVGVTQLQQEHQAVTDVCAGGNGVADASSGKHWEGEVVEQSTLIAVDTREEIVGVEVVGAEKSLEPCVLVANILRDHVSPACGLLVADAEVALHSPLPVTACVADHGA